MGIAETMEYIHNVKWQSRKPGLERIEKLLDGLGNPHKSLKYVHVAGTNGKGSTCAYLASVLQEAGYRTGLFVSPYVVEFNERIQFNGEYISNDDLVRLVDEIRPVADAMEDVPTEYEIIAAIAMKFYVYKECDIVVLEVGMGGEFDATNIIDLPEAAAIATIGYDHVNELGPELTDIAQAKAGIIKGGDVIIYGGTEEVEGVFEKTCKERGANLIRADFSRISNQRESLEGLTFNLAPYGEVTLPLLGTYQPKNAVLATTTLEVLRNKGYNITDENIVNGLTNVYWPGRFEVLGTDPVFILDGSHNPEAVEVTTNSLKRYFGDKKIVFIIGAMADKDVDTMISFIAPLAKEFVACRPDYYRAMESAVLAEKLSSYNVPVYASADFADAVTKAVSIAGSDGIVCTIGSLYFSNDLRLAYQSSFNG